MVVRYAVTEIANKPTVIDLQFMARGANFLNSFGVNGTLYFKDLNGYENVYAEAEPVQQVVRQITLPKADRYVPMLDNGVESFDLDTYWNNREPFPCILEIPIVDNSKFQWCLEGKRIDSAYPRYKDWVDSGCKLHTDWYEDAPVAGLVWNK